RDAAAERTRMYSQRVLSEGYPFHITSIVTGLAFLAERCGSIGIRSGLIFGRKSFSSLYISTNQKREYDVFASGLYRYVWPG
ncbi:MAG: hypothetical protein RQ936_09685, partial [Gammaproteobacteria bacterium]|nr:hypothetical protein [Gammaproteobacteria bacterium]